MRGAAFRWFTYTSNDRTEPSNDKTALPLRILADVHAVGRDKKHAELPRKLAVALKKRFEPYRGPVWNKGVGWRGDPAMDTSHGNRHPHTVVDLARNLAVI